MKICPECGVQVEERHIRCPLCHTSLTSEGQASDEDPQAGRDEAPETGPPAAEKADGGERERVDRLEHADARGRAHVTGPESGVPGDGRLWLFEVVSLLAAVAAIVVFAADFAFGFSLSWAQLPLGSIAYFWMLFSALILFFHRPVLLGTLLVAATAGFLFVIDRSTPGGPWFLELGLPILLVTAILVSAVIWLTVLRGASLLPTTGRALVAAGLITVGVELLVDQYRGDPGQVSWSLVVFAGSLSLTIFLWLIHRRLKRRHTSLDRIFHL